jgi:hypothetical protein
MRVPVRQSSFCEDLRVGAPTLRQPGAVQAAFAAIAASQDRLITALNNEIDTLTEVVGQHSGRHPDAEIYASQPGNYAGTSPVTKASGKKKVFARHARNDRLADALPRRHPAGAAWKPGPSTTRTLPPLDTQEPEMSAADRARHE